MCKRSREPISEYGEEILPSASKHAVYLVVKKAFVLCSHFIIISFFVSFQQQYGILAVQTDQLEDKVTAAEILVEAVKLKQCIIISIQINCTYLKRHLDEMLDYLQLQSKYQKVSFFRQKEQVIFFRPNNKTTKCYFMLKSSGSVNGACKIMIIIHVYSLER